MYEQGKKFPYFIEKQIISGFPKQETRKLAVQLSKKQMFEVIYKRFKLKLGLLEFQWNHLQRKLS